MSVVNKYNNGKVYKIWSPSRPELVYYGSTINSLSKRLSHHKDKYKKYKSGGKCSNTTSFKIFDECSDYRIDLVESFSCNDREQLNAREGFYIRTNECVNKYVAGRTPQEWYQDNKEHKKQYWQANVEKFKARKKELYQANKDEILKQFKQYREANKQVINEKQREHWNANKDAINARRRELYALKKKNNI